VSDEYTADDVNTVASVVPAPTAVAAVTYVVSALVDDADAVEVTEDEGRGKTTLSVRVAPGDVGRVIGRRGRTAQALRTLANAAAARDGASVTVDILD
jgi:predicted RNA-binding protein YlqC (UPF0109 family)